MLDDCELRSLSKKSLQCQAIMAHAASGRGDSKDMRKKVSFMITLLMRDQCMHVNHGDCIDLEFMCQQSAPNLSERGVRC